MDSQMAPNEERIARLQSGKKSHAGKMSGITGGSSNLRDWAHVDWQTPNSMLGGNKSRGGDRKGELLLAGQVKAEPCWPSPVAGDGRDKGMTVGNRRSPNLCVLAHEGLLDNWPTPVANDDNKTPEAHMAMKHRMKGGPRNTITSLNVMVKGGLLAPASPNSTGRPRGCLNARWVASLMGYPPDWCDVQTSSP
jgi:hypothetical protein